MSITNKLIEIGEIIEQDRQIYSYGIEVGLAMIFNIITTVVIGYAFGMLAESILFLIALIPLRSYTGGFHASAHLKCYLLSAAVLIGALLAVKYEAITIFKASIGGLIILFLSPVQDANKPLDELEKKVYGKKARIIACVEFAVASVLYLLGLRAFGDTIFCVLFIVGVSVIWGYVKNEMRAG